MVKMLAISLLLLMSTTVAHAFCSKPTPKVCSSFFNSDAVFTGTVNDQESVPDQDDSIGGWLYRLRITKVFRGDLGQTVAVFTPNDSSRLPLEVGREYLLFARLRDGRLRIGNDCGPLSDPAQTVENVRTIENLHDTSSAVVEGEVLAGTASGDGVPGVSVGVSGMRRTYTATSNSRGLFHVEVAPGRYSIDVDSKVAVLSDLSWIDLSDVLLVPGQCVQVLFIAR